MKKLVYFLYTSKEKLIVKAKSHWFTDGLFELIKESIPVFILMYIAGIIGNYFALGLIKYLNIPISSLRGDLSNFTNIDIIFYNVLGSGAWILLFIIVIIYLIKLIMYIGKFIYRTLGRKHK